MFLLDTVTARPAGGVTRFFEREPEAFLYTSVIVLGELRRGALQQRDQTYRAALLRWLDDDVRASFAGRVLDVTAEVAEYWGSIQAQGATGGQTLPPIDALIAATAIVHGLTVVTRNEAGFRRCGAEVLNPWSE